MGRCACPAPRAASSSPAAWPPSGRARHDGGSARGVGQRLRGAGDRSGAARVSAGSLVSARVTSRLQPGTRSPIPADGVRGHDQAARLVQRLSPTRTTAQGCERRSRRSPSSTARSPPTAWLRGRRHLRPVSDAAGSAVTNLVLLLGQGVTPAPNQALSSRRLGLRHHARADGRGRRSPADTRNARAAVTALRVVADSQITAGSRWARTF